MQTPYNQLRQRQKERKQRINLSIDKPNLALQTHRPFSFNPSLTKLQSSTSKSSRDKHSHQKKPAINLLKRKKLINGLNQQIQETTLKQEQVNHRLLVEGSKCGNDLISLNRRKLQHLISQIKATNASSKHNYKVPQVCLQKSKYRCVKQDKNANAYKDQGQHIRLKLHKDKEGKQRKMLSRDNWLRRSFDREGKDIVQIKPVELNIEANKASINSKSTQKQRVLSPKKSLVRTPKTCKTEQMIKSAPWTPMSFREPHSPKKASYQNVFNMKNLKGWQQFEQCPFVHPLEW